MDKVVQLIMIVGGARITPFVDHKHALPVFDRHRANIWPDWHPVKLQSRLQLEVVHRQKHFANACAMAL